MLFGSCPNRYLTSLAIVLATIAGQLQLLVPTSNACAQSVSQLSSSSSSENDFSSQYTALTKKILLAGIAIERFSLNYRMEALRQPKFRKWRYFAGQEAGAACGLAFEVISVKQFNTGRHHPLKVSPRALKGATLTAMTGSIIAGSGSCLELASNVVHAVKLRRLGFDSKAANKYVAGKLREIDQLLEQRDILVTANANSPAHERAILEGKILRSMRGAFINEYANFNADASTFRAAQNLFFLLNASYNAVGATAAGLAYKAVANPKLNGPANILFIVSGATAAATPMLCSSYGLLIRKLSHRAVNKALHEKPNFDPVEFAAQRKELDRLAAIAQATGDANNVLMPSLPDTQRLALYTESSDLFTKQLENETRIMRKLNKVALETTFLAPAIGGLLMSQGILGTHGYYDYTIKPRKQIAQYYRGAVCGTIGTSMAVVGNAAWLLASLSYEHHLKKKEQLPSQLIQERLKHLDETERLVLTL